MLVFSVPKAWKSASACFTGHAAAAAWKPFFEEAGAALAHVPGRCGATFKFLSAIRHARRKNILAQSKLVRRQPPAFRLQWPVPVCFCCHVLSPMLRSGPRRWLGGDILPGRGLPLGVSLARLQAKPHTDALPGKLTKAAVDTRSAATIWPSLWLALRLQHSTCPRARPLQ